MPVLFVTDEQYLDHVAGGAHPERPDRLRAVGAGAARAGLGDDLRLTEPKGATIEDVARVHTPAYVEALQRFCGHGGGRLDVDTAAVSASWDAALLAVGAGLTAIDLLDAGAGSAAFCAVRPPGHHALPDRAMGFCLFNNVAVAAAVLADRGERVLVVDYDAHHGNGTQAIFYDDPRVVYVSYHQHPLYPGTGSLVETGHGAGVGATINLPLPPGSTGDVYLEAVEEVIAPVADAIRPTWLLLSAGFDAHRDDPLTDLGLSSGDFCDLTAALAALVPAGRCVAFLEGGYDLAALRDSTLAAVGALAGERPHPAAPTFGGPGREIVAAAALAHDRAGEESSPP